MSTYWEGSGPHQEEYMRLREALVADEGMSATIEGELLCAAERLTYDQYNNGGGNNLSGAFYYLRQNLPFFKQEWTDALIPFVSGSGGLYCSNEQLRAVEEILDTTVQYVMSREGRYQENYNTWRQMNVKETGYEISEWAAESRREDRRERGREGAVLPNYETLEMRP
ncbi:hypothetical protein G6L37_06475 [Agrobacterium rubi]|nr:hypothetical protein [Agrobacterium rubi]NTF25008.1 hypothetical protein [Agrobacterium rubi]